MDPTDATLCDVVFVTHEHLDHMHPPSYRPLVRDVGVDLYASVAAYERPDRESLQGRENVVEPGDTVEVGNPTVDVHSGEDPDTVGEVTYVVEHESGTFFHGGDSRVAAAFDDIGSTYDLDLGVLAMGSVGRQYFPETDEVRTRSVYMDEDEMIAAANALELARLAPSHYGIWKGVGANPAALAAHAATFEYPRVVEPIEVGDWVDVGRRASSRWRCSTGEAAPRRDTIRVRQSRPPGSAAASVPPIPPSSYTRSTTDCGVAITDTTPRTARSTLRTVCPVFRRYDSKRSPRYDRSRLGVRSRSPIA